MKKLVISLVLLSISCITYAGNEESPLFNAGWGLCHNVQVTDYSPHSSSGRVMMTVRIENFGSRERGLILAGYVDSFSQKIGWASARKGFNLGYGESKIYYINIPAPFMATVLNAKTFCRY
jgi:hypothetical protein